MILNKSTKIDVLESKFEMYEDLSKQMLDKLESAVEKIGEANNKIATILTKHDERLEQAVKTDDYILKEIENLRVTNGKDHSKIEDRVGSIEKRIEDLYKFRWQASGIIALALIVVTAITALVPHFLTNQDNSTRIEMTK
jgi:uncharacterized coiled-coil DUF342 family protein